jgi:2-deoxy-D-gluconate 3-dehydrogenase
MTSPSLFDLTGKTALVTGGSGGLGGGMAAALVSAGARVAVQGTSEAVIDNARSLKGRSGSTVGIVADFASAQAPLQVIEQAAESLGGIDILVVAHGMVHRTYEPIYPMEQWDQTLKINLTSAFEVSQLAAKGMMEKGHGKIIFVASMLSFSGGLGVPAYTASKGAVAQLTKALCNAWAPRGINVNAIAPGYFETRMTIGMRSDPIRNQQILDRLPAGRWGKPSDLAGATLFLASAASDYVHGIILPVDGGWLAR